MLFFVLVFRFSFLFFPIFHDEVQKILRRLLHLAMSKMKLGALFLLSLMALAASEPSFICNGFRSTNLSMDGLAEIMPDGLLRLSNVTKQKTGHAFYPKPLNFKNSDNGSVLSFSTSFVFAIVPQYQPVGGHGMAFVIAPTRGLPGSLPSTYLGLFNESNNGDPSNHVFAVELDTLKSSEFNDINDDHVGIDVNSLVSVTALPAGYYEDQTGLFKNLTMNDGHKMQVWVEYDGFSRQVNVTLAPVDVKKPSNPLLSLTTDLSPVINQVMYVGFSAAPLFASHYVLGWSFSMNTPAQPLDLSHLPELPRVGPKKKPKILTVGLPGISAVFLLFGILSAVYYVKRKLKFAELLEDWELDFTPQRFRYEDLYMATKGFKEKELLGTGGFGKVYRGLMPGSCIEIAVKKVCHGSRQGMREFVAEISSIGRLRHRNLVPLLGYCRRKGELLLVYEYMPNGSLDKFIHDQPKLTLDWDQRFRVIKGVASGLLYLHEEWEQVVIHRDIKASNILLDNELNARLGDFGLARLYDHGKDPQTTHVVGTVGYLAPEHTRTGKATASTDVYAFGAFLLEVVCGRRPVEPRASSENFVLVEWVSSLWSRGEMLKAVDPILGGEYANEEVELVLNLGLLCSHMRPVVRPSMRQVMLYLEGGVALPELSVSGEGFKFEFCEGFDDFRGSPMFSRNSNFTGTSTVSNALLSGGR